MNRFSGLFDPMPREVPPQVLFRHWNGIPIIEVPDFPKMQVSVKFAELQAPELVAETNAWMKEFFGMDNLLKDGQVIRAADPANYGFGVFFAVNPRTNDMLKSKASAILFPT